VKTSTFFCLFAFILVSNLSSAQILIGPVAGAQYSWVSFDDSNNKDFYRVSPVKGFHAGMALSFLVRKRFFLHTSFLYSVKGKIITGKEDLLLRNEVTYRYIDIPILYTVDFKGKIGNGKEFKYFIGTGPNLSYWLSGKGEYYNTDLSENSIYEPRQYRIAFGKLPEDTQENEMSLQDPNRIQLGLNITAGIVFEPFGYQKFNFNVRYELGHSFFSRTTNGFFSQSNYQDVMRSRNQGLRVSIAYLVDLKVEDRNKGKSTIKKKRL
jgi:hypothetical protein